MATNNPSETPRRGFEWSNRLRAAWLVLAGRQSPFVGAPTPPLSSLSEIPFHPIRTVRGSGYAFDDRFGKDK
jgi:hypothetical protein